MQRLERLSSTIYVVFRVVVGFLFLQHGAQKLFGLFGGMQQTGATAPFMSQMWIGGAIELVCGSAVLLGIGTRWAAFLACGEMAVAYFQFHQKNGALPIQNGGESAVLYCFAFLVIAAFGARVPFARLPSSREDERLDAATTSASTTTESPRGQTARTRV